MHWNLRLQLFGPSHLSFELLQRWVLSSIADPENDHCMSGSPSSVGYSQSVILGPTMSLPVPYMLQMRIAEIEG